MRVAVLGGSSVASIQLAEAITHWPGGNAQRPPLDFTLHGRSEAKLTAVAAEFGRVAAGAAQVQHSLELADVLSGAEVVLVQIRVGGLAARSFDESFPWQAGLPGEETIGPGGFANALRTAAALRRTWEAVRQVCPDALVVILTNPAGIVAQAAARYGLRVVEVCDSPIAFVQAIAVRLGTDPLEVAQRYAGMNHVGWYMPTSAAELEVLSTGQPIAPSVVRAYQAVPLGYVRYYLDPHDRYNAQRGRPTRAQELMRIESAALGQLANGQRPDPRARPAPWYSLAVVPLLDRLANGSQQPIIMGCPNNGRLAPLPADVTVEGLARTSATGVIEPLSLIQLPPLPTALLYRHATYEQLAIQAAEQPSRENLLRAMLANPMIASVHQAEILTDALQASLAREPAGPANQPVMTPNPQDQ